MKVILSDDGLITFEDGGTLNRNTLNRKRLTVVPETALAAGESLWVQFGDNIDYDSAESEILEPIKLEYIEADKTYITLLPDEVLQKPGVWYMTLAIRLYSADGETYQSQLTSEKTSFTVNDSYPLTDGGYASNGTVQNLYNEAVAAKNAAQAAQEAAETAQTAAEDAQSKAETAQEAAEAAQEAAETAEANAEAAEQGAQAAQAAAETAQGKAEDAQAAAETAQAAAETAAGEAASSASAAADSAAEAADSATAAAESANNAAGSALEAQGYMEQAKEYAKKEYKLYDSVDDLPVPGDSAFIYLVPQTGSEENDNYAEYLWISETQRYEFIGTVNDIDLSNYAQKNGTYPDMTVGNANHAASADSATKANHAASADSATKANHAASADRANDPNAVHFTEQTLTAEQQAQARTNIGAASKEALEEGLAGKQPTGDYALQNGSYPSMTVGNATNAANATSAASANSATNADHATTADSATSATNATNATNAETAEKVANALTVTVNGEETKYDGSAAAAVTVSASNPNLLHNSNFSINQRGLTSWTSAGYTVDGWRKTVSAGTVYLNSGPYPPINNCIYFSATSNVYLRQYLETSLKGSTTYTITIGYHTSTSVYISKETSYTFTTPSGTSSDTLKWTPFTGYTVMIYFAGILASASAHCYVQFGRTSSSGTTYYFHYIKLEEGSVATPYEFPNPAEELLKCQRYYVKLTSNVQIFGSVGNGGNYGYVTLWLPAPMRTATPTIVSYTAGSLRINGSNYSTVTDLSDGNMTGNALYMKYTSSGSYDNFQPVAFELQGIELSAELTS